MKRVYMDHVAGMPIDPRVVEAMMPYFSVVYGNPSSIHSFGQEARGALEDSRRRVAELVGAAKKDEVVFTSGGTESNNLAIKGVAYRNKDKGNHIVTTTIEHMSVLNTCKYLGRQGFKITYVPVDTYGTVDVHDIESQITDDTILVSVIYANGEIGTIEPIKQIGEIAHDKKAYFHVDAVAAAGQVPINVNEEHIDLLSLSSNDLYGPKGVGALYIKEGTRIEPVLHGGGQERGLRSGTENLPSIVGMGKAAEIANAEMKTEGERQSRLRARFIKDMLDSIPYSFLNGHPTKRLPNNVSVRFSFIEGESLILSLDMEGVAASTGSACTAKTLEPSHVLRAIGLKHEEAHGSLLFTLGRQSTDEDVDYVLRVLPAIVKRLRAMSPLTPKELM